MSARRSLQLTADAIRNYSRRGNFHSDPALADELDLPGLVAQGAQVAGPAYGLLLDAWGEEFLAYGEIELKFVGMVLEDHVVDAEVRFEFPPGGVDAADIEVVNRATARPAAVGHARRVAGGMTR